MAPLPWKGRAASPKKDAPAPAQAAAPDAVPSFKKPDAVLNSDAEALARGFEITAQQLVALSSEGTVSALDAHGGVSGLCDALRVDPARGISSDDKEIERRRLAYGSNTYPKAKQKSWLNFAWEASKDRTLLILMICAVVSLVAGMLAHGAQKGWYDGVAIALAIIIVVLVSATVNYVQSLQFRGLDAEKANIQLKVLRDGRVQVVSIFQLVVGDVVPLAIGDQVPGDGVLLSGHSLVVDESSMTGESDPIPKSPEDPFLQSGCKVVDGLGTMLITAVGLNTEWGKIMGSLTGEDQADTPLQVRLNKLVSRIGKVGVGVALLVVIILLIRFGIQYTPEPVIDVINDITHILTIGVTLVVVAVPEGLPLAVTLTLAFSMYKMMADKALVRRLSACETMGCATAICSDKTGTLTLNQMTAVEEWLGGKHCLGGQGQAPGGLLWECLAENIAQNGSASVFIKENGDPEVTASPTEAAVVHWALRQGLDFNAERAASTVVRMETFNSTKKRGGAVVLRPDGSARVHWKGAAEIIVGLCSSWMTFEGTAQPLDEEKKESISRAIQLMAGHSLRCMAMAYRNYAPGEVPKDVSHEDSWTVKDDNLVLLAIVGIKDPCRPGVPESVSVCQLAGVKVRMVTGDNVLTARSIAEECGILTPHGLVLEGKELRSMTKEQLHKVIPRIDVVARSSPTDKLLLVQNLREMGEVVAVTGDGTNDAPALKEADIGLSMGISGTEVAKESSDIVILDDNFTSIVKMVRWGRSVFANIQKFIQFQLTVNVSALTINFVTACTSGVNVPLTAVQLLWVNLIMNTMAALALATEPPTPDLLRQKPTGRTAPLITNVMWRNLILMAVYQITVLLVLFYTEESLLGLAYLGPEMAGKVNRTIIFNSFVMCQIFNEINARRPNQINVFEGLHRNPLFLIIFVITGAMQAVMVQFLNDFASTEPLTWNQWVFCIIVGFVGMPIAALVKLIPVPQTPFLDLLRPSWPWRRNKAQSSTGADNATAASDGTSTEAPVASEEFETVRIAEKDEEADFQLGAGAPLPVSVPATGATTG